MLGVGGFLPKIFQACRNLVCQYDHISSPATIFLREFAGRTGGLKRKHVKKLPKIVQIGLGRRLEFFYPKGYQKLRIMLWQNIRPNVVYDANFKRWMATWYVHGQQVFKTFSHRRQPFERARQKAITMIRQMRSLGLLAKSKQRPKPDVSRSGIAGVFFDPIERSWVARYSDHGKKVFKVFSPAKMGFDEAFLAAVAVRKQKMAEMHKFVPQKFRVRRRAPFLK